MCYEENPYDRCHGQIILSLSFRSIPLQPPLCGLCFLRDYSLDSLGRYAFYLIRGITYICYWEMAECLLLPIGAECASPLSSWSSLPE
jgi:hypothetical protein